MTTGYLPVSDKWLPGIMAHAITRGKATASQLYLDSVLDAVIEGDKNTSRNVKKREDVNLAELIFYSMRKKPASVHMINGLTDQSFTNEQMLHRMVPIARALTANGAKGKTIMLVMKNHEQLVSLYYGAIFSGVTLFLLDPHSTVFELRHFLSLVKPCLVFCDHDRLEDLKLAAAETSPSPSDVISDRGLAQFIEGHNDDLDSFIVSDASPDSVAVMLPTSGSTGLAKAALLTHRALIAQQPCLWAYHTQFPRPTELAMFLSTAQWMTHTNMLTGCPVYGITILISPTKTPEHAIELFEKFRPTWALLVPGFATMMADLMEKHQLTSLKTVLVTGAPPNPDTMATLKAKFPKTTHICNSYGMTETQGFTAIPDNNTPFGSPGKVLNILDYKLVDDDGKEVLGAHKNGELYLKGISIVKGYLDNEAAYLECMSPDGWWKTGDVFYKDDDDYLWFVERKKFWFKYLNYHISPEELENIINQVPGVQECAVCGSDKGEGAATAVVVKPGCDVTRNHIHKAINAQLMEYKRLRAGIAFVQTLPRTHSGKLHRRDCTRMVNVLIKNGQCF